VSEHAGHVDPAVGRQAQVVRDAVLAHAADIGMAFDGDGDRLMLVDRNGALADGDDILYVLARSLRAQGLLNQPVVGTLMSNYGLQLALAELGVPLLRANVGDRYVMQLLREHGGILGGETSGHILCLDRATTGDGIVAALVEALPAGSFLVLAHPASDVRAASQAEMTRRVNERMRGPKATMRDRAAISRFFDGLDLAEPGVVQPQQWRPDPGVISPDQVTAWCGVARKR